MVYWQSLSDEKTSLQQSAGKVRSREHSMYKILIFGPQGAGKGTQAIRLARTLGIPAMSMGELLREEISKGTPKGMKFKAIIDGGNLVSDQDALEMLKERLQEPDTKNGYIIDGYPRNISQHNAYVQFDKPTHVVLIELSDDEAVKRLGGRRMCVGCQTNFHIKYDQPDVEDQCNACKGKLIQREDDKPEAIKRRLEIYHDDTEPMIKEYDKMGVVHRVDGSGSIDDVEVEIKKIFGIE